MAHPYKQFRQSNVERSRAAGLTSGYEGGGIEKPGLTANPAKQRKRGGAVRDNDADDMPMAKHRADRPHRASGGKVKKPGVVVNVIAGGQQQPPAPPMMPPPGPPPMPPGPPPGAMPPPGMPMRAKGGAVKSVGMKVGTPVEHDKGKTDTDDMKRPGMKMHPKVVTFATGGGVVSFKTGGGVSVPAKANMGPDLPGGVIAGKTRIAQAGRAKRNYHGPLK